MPRRNKAKHGSRNKIRYSYRPFERLEEELKKEYARKHSSDSSKSNSPLEQAQ